MLQKVIEVVIISSPGPTPKALSVRKRPEVQLETAAACSAPTYSANRDSNSLESGPVPIHPDLSAAVTAEIAASEILGGEKGRMLFLKDEYFQVWSMDLAADRDYRHSLIPGGAHTYSRGDDTFPSSAPPILSRGKGVAVWDSDGNRFVDWAMALKSVSIGHAETAVDFGAHRLARRGVNMSRPTAEEFELAETLKRHIPSAEMVKFGKNGSDATAAAIRLARAYTGRDLVIRPREDPFLGVHDWFIGSTIMNRGVPEVVRSLTINYPRGDLDALESLFRQNSGKVAAVILEPTISEETCSPHYKNLKQIVSRNGAILIFDETITGFRYGLAGAQGRLDVVPDLSTFGKAIANGYPLSALVGRREIMRLGGIDHEENRVFLMSSTYGAERSAIGAGIASLKFMERHDVAGALRKTGTALIAKLISSARDNGLSEKFLVGGDPANPFFSFPDEDGGQDFVLKTLFMEHFLSKAILLSSNWFTPAFRHQGRALRKTLRAIDEVFYDVGNIVRRDHVPLASYLRGQPINQVFRQKN